MAHFNDHTALEPKRKFAIMISLHTTYHNIYSQIQQQQLLLPLHLLLLVIQLKMLHMLSKTTIETREPTLRTFL